MKRSLFETGEVGSSRKDDNSGTCIDLDMYLCEW